MDPFFVAQIALLQRQKIFFPKNLIRDQILYLLTGIIFQEKSFFKVKITQICSVS